MLPENLRNKIVEQSANTQKSIVCATMRQQKGEAEKKQAAELKKSVLDCGIPAKWNDILYINFLFCAAYFQEQFGQ